MLLTIGRITEVGQLLWNKLQLYESTSLRCMQVLLYRDKVNKEQTLNIILHRSSWILCPFHALATMIVCMNCIYDEVFHDLSGSPAASINETFKKLAEDIRDLPRYCSHSMRHGASQFCSDHEGIQTQSLVKRGGWHAEQLTLFSYITITTKSDSRIARVLADWPSMKAGGWCPG